MNHLILIILHPLLDHGFAGQMVSLKFSAFLESWDIRHLYSINALTLCLWQALFAELVMSMSSECPSATYKQYRVLEWRDPIQVKGGIYAAN